MSCEFLCVFFPSFFFNRLFGLVNSLSRSDFVVVVVVEIFTYFVVVDVGILIFITSVVIIITSVMIWSLVSIFPAFSVTDNRLSLLPYLSFDRSSSSLHTHTIFCQVYPCHLLWVCCHNNYHNTCCLCRYGLALYR